MAVSSIISVLVALAVVSGWYLWFRCANRRRARQILEWVECALCGKGNVVGMRWLSPSRCRIALRLPTGFQHASVLVELLPREMPFSWLYHRLRNDRDCLTFEADLGVPPRFNLQVFHHRWCGRTSKKVDLSQRWTFDQNGPFVITSRGEWQREITMMMNSLLASREHEFLSIGFRRRSPHFFASMRPETLMPRGGRASIFDVLHELAADASAARF